MKKTLIFLIFSLMTFFTGYSNVLASGVVTSAENSTVRVVNSDGVMYLSTEASDQSTSLTATDTSNSATDGAFLLAPPEGFAQNIGQLITFLLSTVMMIATLLVLFQLIMGAFGWITSGGDKGKTEAARQRMISAVVGIIIIAASFAIATLVVRFLGFSSFSDVFTNLKTIQGSPAPLVATESATPAPSSPTP